MGSVRRHGIALALMAGAAGLGVPGQAAAAGAPVMPLEQVRPDMQCSAASVVRGTTVTTFRADVVDVVTSALTGEGPLILVRVSGDAVDGPGVGPGFSGSPISCPDAQGVPRVIGAISESVGDASNRLVLATPIQSILGEKLSPRARATAVPTRLTRVRSLAALSVSGLPGWLGRAAQAGAARAGRTVLAAPGLPAAPFAPVDLRPGSAMAVGLATGDLALGAVGTVSYRDGKTIWGFGHPLEGAGRRNLLLQDAYVYGLIDEPGFLGGSFKLAAPGHVVGTLRNDGAHAVVGAAGPAPRTIPVDVHTRDDDRARSTDTRVEVADESKLDDPGGASALRIATGLAVAEGAGRALDGAPARETARMCLRIILRRAKLPLGFCQRYVIDGGGEEYGTDTPAPLAELAAADVDQALRALDANTFARLSVARVRVALHVRRGLQEGFLVGARAPRPVRAGHVVRVRARVRRFRGSAFTVTIPVRVPARLRPGRHVLLLHGTAADTGQGETGLESALAVLFGGGDSFGEDTGAGSLPELAARIAAVKRDDGVRASFPRRRMRGMDEGETVLRSPRLRIAGTAAVMVRVRHR